MRGDSDQQLRAPDLEDPEAGEGQDDREGAGVPAGLRRLLLHHHPPHRVAGEEDRAVPVHRGGYFAGDLVALSFNLISQSNDLLKMSIKSLTEHKEESTEEVYLLLKQTIGFLIVTPDDPEGDYLFLFNGIANALEQIRLKATHKMLVVTDCLLYLGAQMQDRLPVHVEGVYSNDYLFKMKEFRESVMERLDDTFAKLEESLPLVCSSPEPEERKLRCLLVSTLTVLTVMQSSPRLEKYLKSVGEAVESGLSRQKDRKLSALLKPLAKEACRKMREDECEVRWEFVDHL